MRASRRRPCGSDGRLHTHARLRDAVLRRTKWNATSDRSFRRCIRMLTVLVPLPAVAFPGQ